MQTREQRNIISRYDEVPCCVQVVLTGLEFLTGRGGGLADRLVVGQYSRADTAVISHLNISSVRAEDGGRYTCQAVSTAGRATHSARLNVYGPPRSRGRVNLTAVLGRTALIACPVSGVGTAADS